MPITIHAFEKALFKIFSNDFAFKIPPYQRPYAWTTDQASELLTDLLAFLGNDSKPVDEVNPYFLGSIVLIKGEDSPDSDIVDGQQRLNSIWKFKDGKGEPSKATELGEKYSSDIIKENKGKTKYVDLDKNFQDRFDSYPIPVIYLRGYDDEEIRDIFRRLQHGKPLNVGEKLNAYAGSIVEAMRKLSYHKFFRNVIAIKPKRYRHYQILPLLPNHRFVQSRFLPLKETPR